MLLKKERSQLLVIDMQEKLVPAMSEVERLVQNCGTLIEAATHVEVPLILSEQYPQGLGHTLPELLQRAGDGSVIAKVEFSCARNEAIRDRLAGSERTQFVLCGVEAHVCVLQTALDLRAAGQDVFVVLDAVASRRRSSKRAAADRLTASGVHMVTTEMVVFEWAEAASAPAFKALRKLIL